MGKLIIYTGPMKCGKTTHLIQKYNKLKDTTSCVFLKPVIDNRFSNDFIIDRDRQNKVPAFNINKIDDILPYGLIYKNIFVDEFQFLNGNICTINNLLETQCNLFIGGLNLTAEKKPFGKMGELLCFADTIHILKGNCDYCGKKQSGVYTLYVGGKNQDIIVGENNYKCVCSKCYVEHSNL